MNPIKFEIECDIQETCDRYNYTDSFCENGIWWAFPPHSAMAVPIDVRYERSLIWDEEYPASAPFELEMHYILSNQVPVSWKCKRVWGDRMRMTVILVRTDVYPLFWLYWWVYFRVKETLKLTKKWFIYVLEIWGLAETRECEIASWQDIKILKALSDRRTP
ncbi:hypothetical protein [Nostoc sp.]|uniref:hypothetical protein n=1 Tax=Nostoc sp. TaxID=1180 RepID=UPI002FFA02BA